MIGYTLWGLYQYDQDLFANIVLPPQMEHDLFVDVLLEKCGELYPYHQVPGYFKRNIENWFTRRLDAFTRMFEALEAKYSPIENYDRYEDWTDSPDITKTMTGGHDNVLSKSGGHENESVKTGGHMNTNSQEGGHTTTTTKNQGHTDTLLKNGTILETDTYTGGHQNDTTVTNDKDDQHKVSAYNAPQTYDPESQNLVTEDGQQTDIFTYNNEKVSKQTNFTNYKEENTTVYNGEKTTEDFQHNEEVTADTFTYNDETTKDTFEYNNEKESTSFTYQNEQEHEAGVNTHHGHIHGNIGVTTAQKMIEEELTLRRHDLYNTICELFEVEFLVQVY